MSPQVQSQKGSDHTAEKTESEASGEPADKIERQLDLEKIEEIEVEYDEESNILTITIWSPELKHNNTTLQGVGHINQIFIEDTDVLTGDRNE
jgi:uncharacterized protein YuzE